MAIMNHDKLIEELIATKKYFSTDLRRILIHRLNGPESSWGVYNIGQFKTSSAWLNRFPKDVSKFTQVIGAARKYLANNKLADEFRAAATPLLGRQENHQKADQKQLLGLLSLSTSSKLKRSALAALTRIGRKDLPDIFFKTWSGDTPKERTQKVDILLRRENWTLATLKAIENGTISQNDFDISRKQLILTHKDPKIQKAAKLAFQTGQKTKRQDQIEPLRAAIKLKGNDKRGRTIFDQRCAVCHLPPEGQASNGPDLRAITNRTKEGLFSSILDPNQSVDPSYTGYTLTLANGSSLYGRILSENPNHLTLRLLDGSDHQLARRDIKSLTSSKLSLMPEGLEAGLTHQNLADLIIFLQTFGGNKK